MQAKKPIATSGLPRADQEEHPSGKLTPLSADEFNLVTKEFNADCRSFPLHKSMIDLFEEQVQKTPDNIAISTSTEQLSYVELSQRIGRAATWLAQFDLSPDDIVAICLPRDTQLLVMQMAVQMIGVAYLPIDSRSPNDRIDFMLTDAAVKLVITHSHLNVPDVSNETPLVLLDQEWGNIEKACVDVVSHSAEPENLAYIIYTSGSTGKPKGVQITRKNLVHHLSSVQHAPLFSADDIIVALTTVAFDISIVELYLPLLHGARIHLVDQDTAQDGFLLKEVIEKEKITRIDTTPSTFRLLLEAGWEGSPNLTGITGGEALPADLSKLLIPRLKSFWNSYGPTETTVSCTAALITDPDLPITIGKPLPNYRLYILDPNDSPCPINEPGEICIAGEGTARGYLNRPELNEKHFCADPFVQDGSRMYRTGDIGRWLQDGTIEYIGRNDKQVKLRGYRIELGEIESVISQHNAIRYSLVTVFKQDDQDFLAAYVVLKDKDQGTSNLEAEILSNLKESLPPYMVPSGIVVIDELPTTPNGKTDLKALPVPDRIPNRTASRNPPLTDTEKRVAQLWKELTNANCLSRDDNFFEIGGHSLLAMRFVTKAYSEFGQKVAVRSLATSSLAQISKSLDPNDPASTNSTDTRNAKSTQSPMFFKSGNHQLFAAFHHGSQLIDNEKFSPVLICQPAGHEHQRLQRATRQLAAELANSGRDVLRFDYAGTGDSEGELHDSSIEQWNQNIADASRWLMMKTGSETIDAIGIRFGALLLSTNNLPNIQNTVNWDPIESGETWIQSLHEMTNSTMRNYDRFSKRPKNRDVNELFGYQYNQAILTSISQMSFVHSPPANSGKTFNLFSSTESIETGDWRSADKVTDSTPIIEFFDEGQNWNDHLEADDILFTPQSIRRIVQWFQSIE